MTCPDVEYYPGMVNLSGVLCYMNSVLQVYPSPSRCITVPAHALQSLASVTSLIAHLERITKLAVEADLPTPVTDALTSALTGERARFRLLDSLTILLP